MNIFFCIFQKILSILLILIAITLPFSVFINNDKIWLAIFGFLLLSIISYVLIKLSYLMILSTNNPADRKNFFSINKRFDTKMEGSFSDLGFKCIKLQEPIKQEISLIKKKRKKKKIIKN